MLRKIAISSMKGRKKDTITLSLVIILSFLFIVVTTVLHASSEKTKFEQKAAVFGRWKLSHYDGDEKIKSRLLELKDVEKLGATRIIGVSPSVGIVGTINQDLLDVGFFNLYEGRMPEKDDEIALELNQLKQLPDDVNIGDTIEVRIDIPGLQRNESDALREQSERLEPEIKRIAAKLGIHEDKAYNDYVYRLTRSIVFPENINGTDVVVKSSIVYMYTALEDDSDGIQRNYFQEAEEFGSVVSQSSYIIRKMTVIGIFQTYSDMWESKPYSLPNVFITEGAGENFIEKGLHLSDEIVSPKYETPHHFFIDTKLSPDDFYDKYKGDFENLRINTKLYSDTEDSTESTLIYVILLSLFAATIISVFLIYFTQIKRRTRRIALLKSIGATNIQIGKLLFWEVCYILIMTIPIGIVGGVGVGKIVLNILNEYGKTKLNFHSDIRLILLGVLIGIVAIFISILVPMIKSIKIPLTGTISEPPRKKSILERIKKDKVKSKEVKTGKAKLKVRRKLKQVNLDMKIQSYGKISLKTIKHNKGKYLLTAGLYTITLTVLLGSVFLSYLFFRDYIDEIVITSKPSFGYEVNYGMSSDDIADFTEELKSIQGVTKVNVFKGGEGALLWYDGIEHNRMHLIFQSILPSNLIPQHFGFKNTNYVNLDSEFDYLVKDAIVSNIYGIDVEADIYKEFEKAITKGSLNKERFQAGREVILLSPIYNRKSGGVKVTDNNDEGLNIVLDTDKKSRMKKLLDYKNLYDITYDFRKSSYYSQDYSLSVGDHIYLTISMEDGKNSLRTNDVKIAAIIHYFPEKGIWPFADTIENPVIISSYKLVEKLYPATIRGRKNMDSFSLQRKIRTQHPTKYGKSWIYIDVDNDTFKPISQMKLQKIARDRGFKLHEYKESNEIAFKKAFNSTIITVIIGIAVAVITSVILYNTSLSKIEQERDRIGIFQALGVTKEQFKKQYQITAISYGLIALIISHLILSLLTLFTSIGMNVPMYMSLGQYVSHIVNNQFWLYPWLIHIIICIVFFVITILTCYLPLRKILDNQPIDNIRSLGR